jgi:hypothetical protein
MAHSAIVIISDETGSSTTVIESHVGVNRVGNVEVTSSEESSARLSDDMQTLFTQYMFEVSCRLPLSENGN